MRAMIVGLVVVFASCGSGPSGTGGATTDGGRAGSGGAAGRGGASGGTAGGGNAGGGNAGAGGGNAGAGGGNAGAGGGNAGAGGGNAGSSGGNAGSSGGAAGSSGSGGMPEVLRSCRPACTTVAQCATPTVPSYDEDNWSCTMGACDYTGCRSDAECQTLGNYVCRTPEGTSLPLCQVACQAGSGCGTDDAAYAAANFSCNDGVCRWNGCNTDDECQRSMSRAGGSARWLCRAVGSTSFKACYQACSAPADCNGGAATTTPITDADNWRCESDVCRYLGCRSDDECRTTFMGRDYVCR